MSGPEIIRKELRLLIRELGLLNHNCLNSGMTLIQAHILNYLKYNGMTTFTELQIQLDVDKASLSRMLSTLARKQFLSLQTDVSDKRVKNVVISSLGIEAIEMAESEANKYLTSILEQGDENLSYSVADSLKKIRILALKKVLKENMQRLILQPLPDNYQKPATELLFRVFFTEQNIPSEMIPLDDNLHTLWWCARVGEDILGVAASWLTNNVWHWGRFAVEKEYRGLGIGKQLAICSLQDTFRQGAGEISVEARDATVKILQNFGGNIAGHRKDFFGEPITPLVLKKNAFVLNA